MPRTSARCPHKKRLTPNGVSRQSFATGTRKHKARMRGNASKPSCANAAGNRLRMERKSLSDSRWARGELCRNSARALVDADLRPAKARAISDCHATCCGGERPTSSKNCAPRFLGRKSWAKNVPDPQLKWDPSARRAMRASCGGGKTRNCCREVLWVLRQ